MGKDAIVANKMTIKSQGMKPLWTVKSIHLLLDVSGVCVDIVVSTNVHCYL